MTWKFIGLADLDVVQGEEITDGMELYSWRTRGHSDEALPPKEKLAAFWLEANRHRTARDLLVEGSDHAV